MYLIYMFIHYLCILTMSPEQSQRSARLSPCSPGTSRSRFWAAPRLEENSIDSAPTY